MDETRGRNSERVSGETKRRIAEEARRRIELIASRIPGARGLFSPPEKPATAVDRLVVISDIHFGNDYSSLSDPSNRRKLIDCVRYLGDVDEVVLLGDLFDFWTTSLADALEESRDFLGALFRLDNVGRVVYVPGNHDHRIVRLYHDEQTCMALRAGSFDSVPLTIPLVDDCPALESLMPDDARVPLYMVYPWYETSVRGMSVLLTHGHLLGFFERSLWRPKRRFLNAFLLKRNPSVGLDDMEAFLSPYYEMLSLSTAVPGVVDGRYRFYRIVSGTAKALGFEREYRVSSFRDTTVEQNAVEIEALLDHFYEVKPDCFVYGHTHRPGQIELPLSGTLAVNTGCWFNDPSMENRGYSLVEIADEARLLKFPRQ